LEEIIIAGNLYDINVGNDFLVMILKALVTKGNIGKWNSFKINSFCTEKLTMNRVKS
jgi:hypothetical protein